MIEIVANLHMHTPYSDGAWYHRDIAAAAARAGIQAICVTDHNVHVRGIEGYHEGVLVLVGEEVHDCQRMPQVSHLLVYGAETGLSPYAANPQKLIDAVNARDGMCFPAHPYEYASPVDQDLGAYPWMDWDVRGYTGIELWNYMTEWKSNVTNLVVGALTMYFPSLFIRGPFRRTLSQWDALIAAGQRVVAIGNSDAHAVPVRRGPLRACIFDYDYLFRCVNTHVLIDRPLTRNLDTDKRLVYDALRAGRCFVGYDLIASTRDFTFTARSGAEQAGMGDALRRRGVVDFTVGCPRRGQIRLLKDGRTVASAAGKRLVYKTTDPGAYRVEVRRWFRGWVRGWIYSNPIYVS